MRFWDSSAIVALLVEERTTGRMIELAEQDPAMLVWWGTEVECESAIARSERDGDLAAEATTSALERLDAFAQGWQEIQPVEPVRRTARRLLRVHRLRAAGSLQLAAAVVAAEGEPGSLPVVTLDERLADAARREGFRVQL